MAVGECKLLVTTALENTWGLHEEILFLGPWCKTYERRHVWSKRSHETIPFHWDDRSKFSRDYDYLEVLHRSLLRSMAASLNEFHGVDHPTRYWQILLDPWLMSYVSVVFDRWECLRIAFEQTGGLEVIAAGSPDRSVPPASYSEFIARFAFSDEWNGYLFQDIIDWEYSEKCNVRREGLGVPKDPETAKDTATPNKGVLGNFVRNIDRFLGSRFGKYDVVFLVAGFRIPPLIRLNLALGQAPRLFLSEFNLDETPLKIPSSDLGASGRVGLRFDFEAQSLFEQFVSRSLLQQIPTCLVEGYPALRDRAASVPIETKAIVTASSHWHDACAKAWMAEQVQKGAKLMILEHGGSFPAPKELFNFEEDISDVRGTWFLPYHSKHHQLPPSKLVPAFKKALPKPALRQTGGYCSIIGNECARYVYRAHFYPMGAQCLVSLNMVVRTIECLADEIKKNVRVKPSPDQGWNTWRRYENILGSERVLAETDIYRVYQQSRLIICTYPETTFSEAMASGVPTILIYPRELYERHPVAWPLLELMRSARIIFHDPDEAAAHVNAIWADPDHWWGGEVALRARKEFRRQALNLDGDWLIEWTGLLKRLIA